MDRAILLHRLLPASPAFHSSNRYLHLYKVLATQRDGDTNNTNSIPNHANLHHYRKLLNLNKFIQLPLPTYGSKNLGLAQSQKLRKLELSKPNRCSFRNIFRFYFTSQASLLSFLLIIYFIIIF